MKRINCFVSDEAKSVLVDYKDAHGFQRQDDALQDILLKFDKLNKD